MSNSLPVEVARLKRQIDQVKKGQRLSHGASLENAVLSVKDGSGSLRTIVGPLGDGSVGVQPVNGPPPPQPSAPAVASVLGGVSAGWDGLFANGAVLPMDWARIEVHASVAPVFEPIPETLRSTIETAQGATVVIPTDDPVYVRLVARSTSGTASLPSTVVGPYGRSPVVAEDILDGIVTTVKLAEDAVTAANLAPGAVDSNAIADAAVLSNKLADNAVKLGKIDAGAVPLNALTGALQDTASSRYVDAMADPTSWTVLTKGTGADWTHLSGITDAPTGQTVGQATGYAVVRPTMKMPYDPDVLYRISVRVRTSTASAAGSDTLYVGLAGLAADGVTYVNRSGDNSYYSQHYVAASRTALPTASGFVTFTGYVRGRVASGGTGASGGSPDPRVPGALHANVRHVTPVMILNYESTPTGATSATGVMQVDAVTLEALKTGVVDSTNFVAGSVTTAALATDAVTAGKVAADAITARELAVNSVTANELAAGSVTANAVAAGAISTEKLTVTAASSIVQKLYDGGGEASAWRTGTSKTTAAAIPNMTSVAVPDAQSGSQVMRAVGGVSGAWRPDVLIPFDPNVLYRISGTMRQTVAASDTAQQRVYLGVAGVAADGVTIVNTDGAASTGSQHYVAAQGLNLTAGAGWQRVTGYLKGYAAAGATGTGTPRPLPTTPGVLHANARFISPYLYANYSSGTGTAEFNMLTVEVVESGAVQSVNIADGAITTPKLVAGAVQAGTIASSAVTTAKLDALAVTADKIAANAITADKILAGSITATALSATAIDGKTITGAVIQTAATGQRVTVNESGLNKILIYDSTGTAVGELSAVGLGLMGSSGAAIVISPAATYPQVRWVNAAQTNYAAAQVLEPTAADANLSIFCGQFAGSGYTDMSWRTYLGRDVAAIERVRAINPDTVVGGRLLLSNSRGGLWFKNTDVPAQEAGVLVDANITSVSNSLFQVFAPASNSTTLYAEVPTEHTGAIARFVRGGTERFKIDKDGNTTVAGKLTASNIATGTVTVTPTAANTPTSYVLSGINVAGTTFTGFVTANSTVPAPSTGAGGTPNGVNSVTINAVSATSATIWVNRQNTTATNVNWMIVGS